MAKFRDIAAQLRQQLRTGQLRRGDPLPSTRALAQQLGIHRHTVMAAYEELVAEGWVDSLPGWGYRVSQDGLCPTQVAEPRPQEFQWPFHEPLAATEDPPRPKLRYSFPSGQPDLRIFPHEEYAVFVRQALRKFSPEELLGYSEPGGRPRFREQLGHYLRRARGLQFGSQELVVTHGSQEASYLAARCWLAAGDGVAVEEQGFSKVWEAFLCCGAELCPVRIDEEGMVPEALEQQMQQRPVRLIYLTPLHQYPTTVTLSPRRRREIYELARRYDVPLMEDDYDFEFHYRGTSQPPLKTQDPDGRILYCSTFSKVLHPSARLGFLIAPARLAERVNRLKTVVSRQNDNLTQEAVAGWMEEGGFERHLRRMRRHYERRRQCMHEALQRWQPAASWRLPDGGMGFWVDTGVDTDELTRRAITRGVGIRPGSSYRLDGQTSSCLRLGFAHPNPEEIEQGLAILGELRGELLVSNRSETTEKNRRKDVAAR